MGFRAALFFTLVLGTAPAFAKDCEAALTPRQKFAMKGVEDGAFALDEATVKDLGLLDLTFNALKKYLVTEMGRERFAARLTHPLLDSATILERQAATRELAENPELRKKVREYLAALERARISEMPDNFGTLEWHQQRYSTTREKLTTSLAQATIAAVATYAAIDHEGWRYIMGSFMPAAMMGSRNSAVQQQVREAMAPLKRLATASEDLEASLNGCQASFLRQLGTVLRAAHDPEHTLKLAGASEKLRRLMVSDSGVGLSSMLFLTNAKTARVREAVLSNRPGFELLLGAIAELDLTAGLAELSAQNPEAYSFPTILPSDSPETYLKIVDGHHPFVLDELKEKSVANSLEMQTGSDKIPSFYLLTGPNTGGKSTFLRMLANNVALAQIGGPVAARQMTLVPIAMMTNMNVQDALERNQSFFFAQAARVRKILKTAKSQRHMLIIMDEILNGTSPEEHTAIERSIIEYLVKTRNLSILATHDRKLQAMEKEVRGVVNIHVDDKSQDTFKIKVGPSLNRNAVQVLREAGFPEEIVSGSDAYLRAQGIQSSAP